MNHRALIRYLSPQTRLLFLLGVLAFVWGPAARADTPAPAPTAQAAALDLIFVLDNSGSMVRNDPDFITRQVVADFLKQTTPGRRVGMVVYDGQARLVMPLTDLTQEKAAVAVDERLTALTYRGQHTNTPAGIERALYEFKRNGRLAARKAIVLLTDGIVDTGSQIQNVELERWLKNELADQSRDAGVRIFGIAFTDQADFHLIQSLAANTGGDYFRAYKAEDIPAVVAAMETLIMPPPPPAEAPPSAEAPRIEAAPDKTPTPPPPAPRPAPAAPPSLPAARLTLYSAVLLVGLAIVAWLIVVRRRTPPATAPGTASPTASNGSDPKPPPPQQAELIDAGNVVSRETVSIKLAQTAVNIGRDSSNDIVIPSESVSSLHASIEYRNGYFHLEDHRSTNGTMLNGQRVAVNTPVRLKSGDQIHFADVEFRFLLPDQAPLGETVTIRR